MRFLGLGLAFSKEGTKCYYGSRGTYIGILHRLGCRETRVYCSKNYVA